MDTYVYEYGSGLYVNLTNRCNNNCAFCLRHTNQGVGRHRLWLEHEPTAEQVIEKCRIYLRMRRWCSVALESLPWLGKR